MDEVQTGFGRTGENFAHQLFNVKPDIIGVNQHWYSINGHEVPVDAITELDNVEELDESDTV